MSQTIKGKTKSGFEYEIPKENLDNYELVEMLANAEENPLLYPKTVVMLLGREQTERLKDHIRTDTGVVPMEKMTEEMQEIFESQKEVKNS